MKTKQLRLHWAQFAAVRLEVLCKVALAGTALAQAQFGTMRQQLLQLAAEVRVQWPRRPSPADDAARPAS